MFFDENKMVMLEKELVELLKAKKLTITTAESCTAGIVSASIVNISGASSVFKEGFITYCDEAKHDLLGVSNDTLDKYKAVSSQTAKEMAFGAAKKANANVGIAVTGVAGPEKEDDKPVGLVYIGVYYNTGNFEILEAKEFNFAGDRQAIRYQAVENAFKLAIEYISITT